MRYQMTFWMQRQLSWLMRTLWTEYLSQCLGFQLTSGSILSKEKQNDKVIGVSVLSSLDMKPNIGLTVIAWTEHTFGQARAHKKRVTSLTSALHNMKAVSGDTLDVHSTANILCMADEWASG